MHTSSSTKNNKYLSTVITIAETATWYCAVMVLGLIVLTSITNNIISVSATSSSMSERTTRGHVMKGTMFLANKVCDEIYVVGEGETLHTISDKCGDPYIIERNPHVHDSDDVFPGLVIKITPSKTANRKFLRHSS